MILSEENRIEFLPCSKCKDWTQQKVNYKFIEKKLKKATSLGYSQVRTCCTCLKVEKIN